MPKAVIGTHTLYYEKKKRKKVKLLTVTNVDQSTT